MLLDDKYIAVATERDLRVYIQALHSYIHALHMQNMIRQDKCDLFESLYKKLMEDKSETIKYQYALQDLQNLSEGLSVKYREKKDD